MKLSSNLCGVAGEYLVAAELSRRGYVASLTLRKTRGIDILASNGSASESAGIQVKTNQGSQLNWLLTKPAEDYFAEHLFYVFVNLNHGQQPDYYIVPSEVVASSVKTSHGLWLRTTDRHGRAHNDSSMRKFSDRALQAILGKLETEGHPTNVIDYHNRWDLLGLGD